MTDDVQLLRPLAFRRPLAFLPFPLVVGPSFLGGALVVASFLLEERYSLAWVLDRPFVAAGQRGQEFLLA